MHQPKGFVQLGSKAKLCRLHKALYVLKPALRAWFHKLKTALLGF